MTGIGNISFAPLSGRTVGFDRLFDNIDNLLSPALDKYPPHNIVHVSDNQYVVELAVAGFKREEIEISITKGVLNIQAKQKTESENNIKYIYKGISNRVFTKTFKLADSVVVRGAEFKDGILRIALENIIPEEQQYRKIEIGDSISFSQSELLKG